MLSRTFMGAGFFNFVMAEEGVFEWDVKKQTKEQVNGNIRDLILKLYQPADEFNFDVHISTRQLLSSLSEHFNLGFFNENDMVALLQSEGFIWIDMTGHLEFEWLFKKR